MSSLPPSPQAPESLPPSGALPRSATAGGSHLAHSAFWIMVRRVTLVAASVDVAFLVLFLLLDSPFLAWLNIVSIALYACAYQCTVKRFNTAAILLIWLEVLGHAAIGSLLVGWDSGFHYYLLMFIPAIVVSSRKGFPVLVLVLLGFYLGLHAACRHYGVSQPLSAAGLAIVHAFNVSIVFGMASYTARFYYGTVRRAERKLVELATRDPLTGLANRRHFLALAKHDIARAARTGESLALVIADIDHFKRINDSGGHEAGDQVLRDVAAVLARLCRAQDVVARWGGEEFLLLLPNTSATAAVVIAERIRATVAEGGASQGGSATTLSLGVAELGRGEELDRAIARADQALYQSKQGGRNRVTVAAQAAVAAAAAG